MKLTLKQKITMWIVVTILSIPCITIFADDGHSLPWINFLGLGYTWLMIKLAPRFLPEWMVDYFNHIPEEDEDEM